MSDATVRCPACGTVSLVGDAFCTSCGAAAPSLVAHADPTIVAAPAEAQTRPITAASIERRAASWSLDSLVIVVAFAAANAIHALVGVLVLVLGTSVYYVGMLEGPWGGTVGHRVVGLSVVDAETHEGVGRQTAGLRLAINAVLAVPLGIGLLLNIPTLRRCQGRAVHDIGSGTIVVRVR